MSTEVIISISASTVLPQIDGAKMIFLFLINKTLLRQFM